MLKSLTNAALDAYRNDQVPPLRRLPLTDIRGPLMAAWLASARCCQLRAL